jgi:methyl-accepting chemotaxis protein
MLLSTRLSRLSLASQTLAASLATSLLVMSITAGVVAWSLVDYARSDTRREMNGVLGSVLDSLNLVYSGAIERAGAQAPGLIEAYGGVMMLDPARTRTGATDNVPTLTAGGKVVNNDNAPIETAQRWTGADSAVLVKSGNDWVYVATLLRDGGGNMLIGQTVPPQDFVARQLTLGMDGVGLIERDNRFFTVYVQPFTGADGKAFGGLAILTDVNREVNNVLRYVAGSTVAEHARMFVMAPTTDGAGRQFLVHPTFRRGAPLDTSLAGADLVLVKGLVGDNKQGFVTGELGGEAQLLAYRNVPGLNWTVVAAGPESAFLEPFYTNIATLVGLLLGGGLLTGVLIYWRTARTLRPVRTSVAGITRLGDGDLRTDVPAGPAKSANELHVMANGINTARARISQLARQMGDTGAKVASASSQTLETLALMERSTQVQASAAAGVATAVEELSASISRIADSSRDATGFSQASSGAAQEGADVVRATVAGMAQLAQRIAASAETVHELEHASREISEVTRTIQEIAEQTNLLALNAAIEAARAGEGGRGFSVVADEVRRLAERTKESTAQISHVIRAVQQKTQDAAQAMRTVDADMQATAGGVRQAGDVLDRIRDAALRTAAVVAEISSAAVEQHAASAQISTQVEQIAQQTERAAVAIHQSVATGESLQEQARALDSTIRSLRT